MELTPSGFYKTPRIIKGFDFLSHILDTWNSGNAIYVKFGPNRDTDRVLSYHRVYDLDSGNAVRFQISEDPRKYVLLEDVTEFEFIQYRPQTDWMAINMEKTQRIGLEDFDELFISDTFRHLKPVIFLHQDKLWHVMGLELTSDYECSCWFVYLKRQDSDFMTRIRIPLTQKFIYNPLSNSWALDDPTEEITDHEKIKEVLRKEGVWEVTVSGVPMKLIRVMNIASDVLFFIFKDEDDKSRYYYARRSTKLRIVTDVNTLEVKYLLDHVKAIHVG